MASKFTDLYPIRLYCTAHCKADRSAMAMQGAQKLLADVIWQADRLASELADSERAMTRQISLSASAGNTRNVADVDNDLESLENERSALEHTREQAMRKHERLK